MILVPSPTHWGGAGAGQLTSRASRTNHDFAQMEPGRISCASLPTVDVVVLHCPSWIPCFIGHPGLHGLVFFVFYRTMILMYTHTLGIPVSPCLPIQG